MGVYRGDGTTSSGLPVETYAVEAAASATAAAASASTASASAGNSAESADASAASAAAASTSETNAAASAAAALVSENNAATSEANAATSETNAAASEAAALAAYSGAAYLDADQTFTGKNIFFGNRMTSWTRGTTINVLGGGSDITLAGDGNMYEIHGAAGVLNTLDSATPAGTMITLEFWDNGMTIKNGATPPNSNYLSIYTQSLEDLHIDRYAAVQLLRCDNSDGEYWQVQSMSTMRLDQLHNLSPSKGALISGTTAGDYVMQSAGSTGQILTADSTQTAGLKWNSPAYAGRNLILNGDGAIYQRQAAATVSGAYHADRWQTIFSTSGALTSGQGTIAPTLAQSGLYLDTNVYAQVTTADASIAAGDYCFLQQQIEGYRFKPAVGKTLVLSFWVRSSLTGVHCVALRNSGTDRSYVAEYTVNAVDTWEYKTITVTAPTVTSGTWDLTTGTGLRVTFSLACGSTYQTTAGSWKTGSYLATSNQVNLLATIGNTLRITAVQLEAAPAATPFEQRPWDDVLRDCQRYYEKSYTYAIAPGTADNSGRSEGYVGADGHNCSPVHGEFRVTKRASPTVTWYSTNTGASGKVYNVTGAADATLTASYGTGDTATGFPYITAATTVGHLVRGQWDADAEL